MPDGGVVTIATRPVGGEVEISVSDTGAGMPSEVLEQAVAPRFSTQPKGQVSGLGLTIVDRIVRTLGGDVRIESTVGAGTTVRMRLPEAGDG
jgi:signal transduction histidine kinase